MATRVERALRQLEAAQREQEEIRKRKEDLLEAQKAKRAETAQKMRGARRKFAQAERTLAADTRKKVEKGFQVFGEWSARAYPDQLDVALLDVEDPDKKTFLQHLKDWMQSGGSFDE